MRRALSSSCIRAYYRHPLPSRQHSAMSACCPHPSGQRPVRSPDDGPPPIPGPLLATVIHGASPSEAPGPSSSSASPDSPPMVCGCGASPGSPPLGGDSSSKPAVGAAGLTIGTFASPSSTPQGSPLLLPPHGRSYSAPVSPAGPRAFATPMIDALLRKHSGRLSEGSGSFPRRNSPSPILGGSPPNRRPSDGQRSFSLGQAVQQNTQQQSRTLTSQAALLFQDGSPPVRAPAQQAQSPP